jgi:hypothetical protein
MNRLQRRAMQSMKRKDPGVSTALLRKQLQESQYREAQFRNVVFALLKEQGRLRFKQATIDSLDSEDGIDAKTEGEWVIFTYQRGAAAPKESA